MDKVNMVSKCNTCTSFSISSRFCAVDMMVIEGDILACENYDNNRMGAIEAVVGNNVPRELEKRLDYIDGQISFIIKLLVDR